MSRIRNPQLQRQAILGRMKNPPKPKPEETKKEVKTKLSPFEQERQVLLFFKATFPTKAKKLVRLAQKVYDEYPSFIQNGLLQNIMVAKDPIAYLETCFDHLEEFPEIIDRLIAEGNHGMVIYKRQIYGLEIKTVKNWLRQGDKWDYEQELDIQDSLINAWMDAHEFVNVKDAKIVLFDEFGFSGMPRGFSYNTSEK